MSLFSWEGLTPTCRTYGSSEELINDPDVEGILIATETAYHAEYAIKVIEAGKVSKWLLVQRALPFADVNVLLACTY